jgi:hypothetical protein
MQHNYGQAGDSGGPWYIDNRMYGLHTGGCYGYDGFAAADHIDQHVGDMNVVARDWHTSNQLMTPPYGSLWSEDGRSVFVMQGDGNLVLYHNSSPVWATSWLGCTPESGNYAVMQSDGNFVYHRWDGSVLWHAGTYGNGGAHLIMQSDGNLVIYNDIWQALWASNTGGF